MLSRMERLAFRVLTEIDAVANRLYGSRWNPLYQSGTIVVALYLTILVTGLWLILFYRVATPWESVASLTANPWIGNWVRGLHRYASDAAVLATFVHAFRMFAQGRSWGARTLAWVSGGILLVLLLFCGWTGYVLVWDAFGERLAREGTRMLDTLPVLSEPTSRTFTGERPVPGVFFFVALFAHIGIPLGMAVVFWLHIKRLERPALLPPRALGWSVVALLSGVAIARPMVMAPAANAFVVPAAVPTDLIFAFWIPLARRLDGVSALTAMSAMAIGLLLIPALTRRRGAARPPSSTVDEDICTGCLQCSLDCPYGAIQMVERNDSRPTLVARVDSALCVSCGICAGSCAPMGVGPPGRTGRDQIAGVQTFLASPGHRGGIVAICCDHGAGVHASALAAEGTAIYTVDCAGNLHTSVIEILLRGGAAGILVLACQLRDCRSREGPRWLVERMYHGREAELQTRVDRRRVKVVNVSAGERGLAVAALRAFADELPALSRSPVDQTGEIHNVCEPAATGSHA